MNNHIASWSACALGNLLSRQIEVPIFSAHHLFAHHCAGRRINQTSLCLHEESMVDLLLNDNFHEFGTVALYLILFSDF